MSDGHVISESAGTITVAPSVLAHVVRVAAESADGARIRRARRGLDVAVDDGRARVSVELAVRYGAVLPDVAEEVQQRVAEALRSLCGLEAAGVDVTIEELDG
jgi:uncharacterized alkaline shock family protein YloU